MLGFRRLGSWPSLSLERRRFTAATGAFRHYCWPILYWMPTAVVLTHYFYSVNQVTGRSMQPTLNPDSSLSKDVVLFDRLPVEQHSKIRRGDVISLWSPTSNTKLVKRVIGLGGDLVKTLPPYPHPEVRIPEGHIWVEGDHHFVSEDSNTFGPISLGLVDAKLVYILWPPDRFGPLSGTIPTNRNSPAWRHYEGQLQQDEWRKSRVIQSQADGIA